MNLKLFFLFIVFFSVNMVFADETIVVPVYQGYVDVNKKLIVVNYDVNYINAGSNDDFNAIFVDQLYSFEVPQETMQVGVAYHVHNNQDTQYTLYFTELPIIYILASEYILNEPKVHALFIMAEPSGDILISDIGIERRGGSSLYYPKSNFLIEFWSDSQGTEKVDVSLLNMRTDDDWNLQALWVEPMRVRTKVCNDLWMSFHTPYYANVEPDVVSGIHSEFAEILVNGVYCGVYAVTERIDRKQLQLKDYSQSQGVRGELYKGQQWGEGVSFLSLEDYNNNELMWSGFEYIYPEEITDWSNLHAFVDFVVNSSNQVFYQQYRSKFNLQSAVDYFVFLNLIMALDNTGKNIFIARYAKNEPYIYVPWDMDGSFGNFWDGSPHYGTSSILSNGFFNRMIHDCSDNGFYFAAQQRWQELRQDVFTHENIMQLFRENHDFLLNNAVYEREEKAWGTYYTYTDEYLNYVDTWLTTRLAKLDDYFSRPCESYGAEQFANSSTVFVYPNPAVDKVSLVVSDIQPNASVTFVNTMGQPVYSEELFQTETQINLNCLYPGMYTVLVNNNSQVTTLRLLITP